MEKETNIVAPPGYEIDKENSTFECIESKPKKLTYEVIAEKLFGKQCTFTINRGAEIIKDYLPIQYYKDPNNCLSEKQCKKLLALNQLINVAKYLNGDWEPNFNSDSSDKYFHVVDVDNTISVWVWSMVNLGIPCFKSRELAEQAIEILGEETIKLALTQV